MRSRERHEAIKQTGGTCCLCKRKQSKAKNADPATTVPSLEVHHMDGIDWENIIGYIRKELLSTPERLAPLCRDCHAEYDEKRHLKKENPAA